MSPLITEAVLTATLAHSEREEIVALCNVAYDDELSEYLANAGLGVHLIGREGGVLVSHVMLVERALQVAHDANPMRTGYVELVATHPQFQGRGFASQLMREIVAFMQNFEIAALSPSDERFYARLGWEVWRGPLSVRTVEAAVPTPDERVMILKLPLTPPDLNLDAPLSIEWRVGEVW